MRSYKTIEAADFLSLSPHTLRKWRSLGVGPPYIQAGHKPVYLETDLIEWQLAHRRQPSDRTIQS